MAGTNKKTKTNSRLGMVLPLEFSSADAEKDKAEVISVLVFEVGGAAYAIGVEQTEGVVDCPRITPLPSPPEAVAGLTSVRGRMTVVMELGSNSVEQTVKRRLILVKADAQLGLLADRIEGVVGLEPKKLRPLEKSKEGVTAQRAPLGWPAKSYFKRGKRSVPLIDVERLAET